MNLTGPLSSWLDTWVSLNLMMVEVASCLENMQEGQAVTKPVLGMTDLMEELTSARAMVDCIRSEINS